MTETISKPQKQYSLIRVDGGFKLEFELGEAVVRYALSMAEKGPDGEYHLIRDDGKRVATITVEKGEAFIHLYRALRRPPPENVQT